jgi:hypothetical protein
LIKFKFGFENLLKIGFEKLEKEKEKRNPFHSEFGPFLFAAQRARPAHSRGLLLLRGPSRGRRPRTHARLPSPIPVADDTGPHVRSPPSSSHRRLLSKILPIRFHLLNLPLSFFSDASWL